MSDKRNYPLTIDDDAQASALNLRMAPADDKRFTLGLVFRVSEVLRGVGYPDFESHDFVDLQQALYRFLYTRDGRL